MKSPTLDKVTELASVRCGRSDGMCWALYYLGKTKIETPEKVAASVIESRDVIAMLTLYWTGQHIQHIVDYCALLDTEDCYELDKHWSLYYQIYFDGHLGNPYADNVFPILKASNFSLFGHAVDTAPMAAIFG